MVETLFYYRHLLLFGHYTFIMESLRDRVEGFPPKVYIIKVEAEEGTGWDPGTRQPTMHFPEPRSFTAVLLIHCHPRTTLFSFLSPQFPSLQTIESNYLVSVILFSCKRAVFVCMCLCPFLNTTVF